MSHAIEYYTYPYETSTAKIMTEMNEKAASCGDSGGLYYPIRFETRTPFEDKEAAEAYIKRIDRDYLSIAVPFYDYSNSTVAEPQSLKAASEKTQKALNEWRERERRQYYTPETVASKTIGCKACESKLAVKYLRGNLCPLCRAELRPESELKRIEALRARYNKAAQAQDEEELKYQAKVRAKVKPETRWLVKIEYHC